MLDTLACIELIGKQAGLQHNAYKQQLKAAELLWQELLNNPSLQETLRTLSVLTFLEPLATKRRLPDKSSVYSVCGIDGSQIYPDRHEGFSEYLINIGTAHFDYGISSWAQLKNQPTLLHAMQQGALVTPEYVNAQRTDYELRKALQEALEEALEGAAGSQQPLIMFDGALFFWHLQTPALQECFLASYLASLAGIERTGTRYIGYISASHSRECITLLEKASLLLGQAQTFDHLVDTDLMKHFLEPGEYTQPFKSTSLLAGIYPASLEPCFIYVHMASEVARIEVPTYCADSVSLNEILAIVVDQHDKGGGYPVALSEAHEQAVVKAADREFFYTLLRMHYNQSESVSLKLSKKRSASV